jgi:hypothetical protein
MADYRLPTRNKIQEYAAHTKLVLYADEHGRTYAFAPETIGGAPCHDSVLDKGYAYVMLRSRRGLRYDVTEEGLGASRTMPAAGATLYLRLVLAKQCVGSAFPPRVTLRVAEAYREGMRTIGLIKVESIAARA